MTSREEEANNTRKDINLKSLIISGWDYKLKETDSDTNDLGKYIRADIEYRWAKLMREVQINSFKKKFIAPSLPSFISAW